ncbi:MAG: pilus assembly protein PilM [Candidatus Kerfeldbacteria bacterium]|nr:pilus assembly protein PilM [Candidatus Kerfeldbacteria bacterium]
MASFGLDISDSVLRLAVVEKTRHGWRLPVRAEVELPAGAITDGDIIQPDVVVEATQNLYRAAGVKHFRVAISIPERHTFVKLIAPTNDSGGTTDERIAAAIVQDLPYSIEEVYWDWHDLQKKNSLNQDLYLVGAAPKSTVDSYLKVMKLAGLEVERLEIESLAIARALFGLASPADTRIILDLGRTRSTLILVEHGVVQFTSTVRYAGRELNRFIADELHISEAQAEKAKALFGLDPRKGKGLLRRVLAPHLDVIAETVKKFEQYYTEHFVDHSPVTAVHVTGSGALLLGIREELQRALNHEVVVEPAWVYQQFHQLDDTLPADIGYTFTTAFGLALDPEVLRP